jgi:nucleotide-binding universal stress UspA family protein
MTITITHVIIALIAGLLAGAGAVLLVRRRQAPRPTVGRILLPFTGTSISKRTLQAALRLAQAEDATLVPAYLVEVPLQLPLDSPLQAQCEQAMPLLESIEHKAARAGVQVDSRIERGRTPRDALRRVLAEERFDRVVVPAASVDQAGFSPRDIAWMLEEVPSEIAVIRPATGSGAPPRNGRSGSGGRASGGRIAILKSRPWQRRHATSATSRSSRTSTTESRRSPIASSS